MRKRYRLRTDAQFKRVRGTGRSWAHPLAVLYALPNGEGVNRVGFSVSKRVGNAVTRNRAKRRLRETLRQRWAALQPGFDLLLIARAPIADAPFSAVVAAVDYLLQRARLQRPPEVGEDAMARREQSQP
ncbi:MAG: ribonuclease P protein component [Chloroflexi bacterium]|nr:ribonuclease P protein component [Chloroflexota bacterium]